jgi:hypothetical protein
LEVDVEIGNFIEILSKGKYGVRNITGFAGKIQTKTGRRRPVILRRLTDF